MICLTIFLVAKNPADASRIRDLLGQSMRSSRTEPGCLRFDVYHSEADPRRFVLVEHWESVEALERHRLAEAYTTIYKPQVMPLVDREAHPSSLLE